jgi:hypothetical protein
MRLAGDDEGVMDLQVDQQRLTQATRTGRDEESLSLTGIFVRAKGQHGWGSYDIALLTRESLWQWLTSLRPDAARATVLALLGHDHTNTEALPREPER